jgi:proteic killer suppression protein/toxin YoeB
MEIKYENGRVRKVFSDYQVLIRCVGLEITRSIKKRLNEIGASANFQSWLNTQLGKPHSLVGSDDYAVSINSNLRLVLQPETNDNSLGSLLKCKSVVVKGVCDYHGGKTNWIIP